MQENRKKAVFDYKEIVLLDVMHKVIAILGWKRLDKTQRM